MDLRLDGKTALVTGSSKVIGRSIAAALAREGVHVVVHGRDHAEATQVAEVMVRDGTRADAVAGDLTRDEDVERLVRDAERLVGATDILVNNAGGSGPKDDWQATAAAEWAATYDRNVLAAVRLSTCLLPAMRRTGWGRIVNISSGAAKMPPTTGPDYAAAKAAMNAMTASMAKAVASDGVTVNAVSPGTIRSPRQEEAFRAAAAARGLAARGARARGPAAVRAGSGGSRRRDGRGGGCRRLSRESARRIHHRRQPRRGRRPRFPDLAGSIGPHAVA